MLSFACFTLLYFALLFFTLLYFALLCFTLFYFSLLRFALLCLLCFALVLFSYFCREGHSSDGVLRSVSVRASEMQMNGIESVRVSKRSSTDVNRGRK